MSTEEKKIGQNYFKRCDADCMLHLKEVFYSEVVYFKYVFVSKLPF